MKRDQNIYLYSVCLPTNPGCEGVWAIIQNMEYNKRGCIFWWQISCATCCITICRELEVCYGTILQANAEFTFFVELEGKNVFV